MGPTQVVLWDPGLVGLLEILTVAREAPLCWFWGT